MASSHGASGEALAVDVTMPGGAGGGERRHAAEEVKEAEASLPADHVETSAVVRRCVQALVIGSEFIASMLMAVLMPFYPEYARVELGASSMVVGVIFSLFPITVLVASPLAGFASRRFGRVRVLLAGILSVGAGTIAFGLSKTIEAAMATRVVQGLGVGLLNVGGMALLLQVSLNVERDVGLVQVAAGGGFLVGPPLGGVMYKTLGFFPVFALLASLLFAVAVVLASTMAFIPRPPRTPGKAPASFLSMCTLPVLAGASANTVGFMALSFCYPTVEPHLERALGLDPAGVGLLFTLPSFTYMIVSSFAEVFVPRLGARKTVALGLAMLLVSTLLFGPAPFLLPPLIHWSRAGAWVSQVSSQLAFGVGFCFILVATIPLQRSHLASHGPERDDLIAALDSSSYSLGEALGPVFAGVAMQMLPKRREISCHPTPEMPDCETGVSFSSLAFSFVLLATLLFFLSATPRQQGGKDGSRTSCPSDASSEEQVPSV